MNSSLLNVWMKTDAWIKTKKLLIELSSATGMFWMETLLEEIIL